MKFLILFFIFITPISFAKELQITNNIEGSGLEIINHSNENYLFNEIENVIAVVTDKKLNTSLKK